VFLIEADQGEYRDVLSIEIHFFDQDVLDIKLISAQSLVFYSYRYAHYIVEFMVFLLSC